MQKRMTITIDEAVYDGLLRVVGRGRISGFLEGLARPHVLGTALDEGYRQMASDSAREQEASDWIEGLAADAATDAPR